MIFSPREVHERLFLNAERPREMRAHSKIPFAERLRWCLERAHDSPSMIHMIGVIDTDDGLLVHSRALAAFMGIKANSLNRNLRDHGFRREPPLYGVQDLQASDSLLPSEVRRWSKWTHVGIAFNRDTQDHVIKQISNRAAMTRKGTCIEVQPCMVFPSVHQVFGDWSHAELGK